MITRSQALEHGHSPMLWGLLAAAVVGTAEIVAVVVWNAWEYREQLGALAGRLLRP